MIDPNDDMREVDPDDTCHFLPDYHDCPDINEEIYKRLTVPVSRVPARTFFEEKPFETLVTEWNWLNMWGPLTKETFLTSLEGAIQNFAGMVNKEFAETGFVTYPISYNPPTKYGRAYHDWTGAGYPFDLRFIIAFSEQIKVPAAEEGKFVFVSGLVFYLATLIEAETWYEIHPEDRKDAVVDNINTGISREPLNGEDEYEEDQKRYEESMYDEDDDGLNEDELE